MNKEKIIELQNLFLEFRKTARENLIEPNEYFLGLLIEASELGINFDLSKEEFIEFLSDIWDQNKENVDAIRTAFNS